MAYSKRILTLIAVILIAAPAVLAASISGTYVSRLFADKEGFAFCIDDLNQEADVDNCFFINNVAHDYDSTGANNDKFTLIAFNTPLEASFYEHDQYNQSGGVGLTALGPGASISISYSGSGSPNCTYRDDDDDPVPPLPCTQGVGGESALSSYTVDGRSVWVLNLDGICREDREHSGYDCSQTWNDEISSYKITSIGSTGGSNQDGPPGTDGDFSITPDIESPGGEEIPLGLADKVVTFYNWALGIGGLVGLAVIIYGGFLYASSAGNPGRLGEAKAWIQHGLVGLLLLFSSFIILRFINPDLTTIEDIVVTTNPTLEAPSVVFPEDFETFFYNGPDCDGWYDRRTAPVGNFGDHDCERPELGLTGFVAAVRTQMTSQMLGKFCSTNVNRLTGIMIDTVVSGESGYNPNAYNANSTSGHGAYGLFQMNPMRSNQSDSDVGDVPWRDQVQYAVGKLVEVNGEGAAYWAQWPAGVPGLVECEIQNPPIQKI